MSDDVPFGDGTQAGSSPCLSCGEKPSRPGYLLCEKCGKRKAAALERKRRKQAEILAKRKRGTK